MRKKTRGKILTKVVPGILAFAMVLSMGASAIAGVVNGSIVVGDDHDTGIAPDSQAHGEYTLDGPVFSGERTSYDAGANSGDGGDVTTTDAINIDKTADFDPLTGEGTITLTVNADSPVNFMHYPPPTMDYVFVVDVTSSMLQPRRNTSEQSNWQAFWDDRTRIYKTREALKDAANIIWDANPNSTITVIPFANGAMKPLATGGFDYSEFRISETALSDINETTDPAQLAHIHIPTDPAYADMENFRTNAGNATLTQNYNYYMATKAQDGATFEDAIDALPLASNTDTYAGVNTALEILESGDLPATDQLNREVLLITDGGANISDRASDLLPDQYYPRAAEITADTCQKIKDPLQGNATLSVVSIFPVPILFDTNHFIYDAPHGNNGYYVDYTSYDRSGTMAWTDATASQPPYLPNTKPSNAGLLLDVQNGEFGMCTSWATSPAHYYGADDSGSAVYIAIENSVRESVDLFAGYKSALSDALNTQYFEMDMSVEPVIKVTIDGGDELSPGDPGFPESIHLTRTGEGVSADLGTIPYGDILVANSKSTITITYAFKIKDDVGPHFEGLHTNIDDQTYFEATPPRHQNANDHEITYTDDPFYLPFPTPIVTLDEDPTQPHLTLQKVDENGNFLAGATFRVGASGMTDLEVSPLDAAGEEFVVEPHTTYTIHELAAPSAYQPLSGDIVITTDGDGVPTLTSNPDNAAALAVTSAPGDPVRATLVVTNTPGGGGGENNFKKVPSAVNVKPGETVDYTISGFENTTGKTVTNYAITDVPPRGLDFVTGKLPAFTGGTGLTYSIKYSTNQRSNVVMQSDLSAETPQVISAPALASGEYLTALAVVFDSVPSGFGSNNTISYTFRVAQNPPSATLTNRAMLSYDLDGNSVVIDDPGVPINTGGSSSTGSSSNTKTADTSPLLPIACVMLAGIAASVLIRKSKSNEVWSSER